MTNPNNESNWKKGEAVHMAWKDSPLKKSGSKSYAYIIHNNKYICIRESQDNQRGILLKVVGDTASRHVMLVRGNPFCKDYSDLLIDGKRYCSYPFPRLSELKMVLSIIRSNPMLRLRLEEENMHIDPSATFWVSETKHDILLRKRPQYYAAQADRLFMANKKHDIHCRLSVVYF